MIKNKCSFRMKIGGADKEEGRLGDNLHYGKNKKRHCISGMLFYSYAW